MELQPEVLGVAQVRACGFTWANTDAFRQSGSRCPCQLSWEFNSMFPTGERRRSLTTRYVIVSMHSGCFRSTSVSMSSQCDRNT